MELLEVYHGSYENNLNKIDGEKGIFGGVFATCDEMGALSHGEYLYVITATKLLTNFELNYSISDEEYEIACKIVDRSFSRSRYELDELVEAVFSDRQIDDMTLDEVFEVQTLRGKIAKALGYDAVEMSDEHGTSYLCLDTCTISRANGHSNY